MERRTFLALLGASLLSACAGNSRLIKFATATPDATPTPLSAPVTAPATERRTETLAGARGTRVTEAQVCTVTADTVFVRKESKRDSAALGTVSKGDRLGIVGDALGDWLPVMYNDQTGYIHVYFCQRRTN